MPYASSLATWSRYCSRLSESRASSSSRQAGSAARRSSWASVRARPVQRAPTCVAYRSPMPPDAPTGACYLSAPVRSPAVGEQASVLVVEDDPGLRLLARVNLELDQFSVREAATLE